MGVRNTYLKVSDNSQRDAAQPRLITGKRANNLDEIAHHTYIKYVFFRSVAVSNSHGSVALDPGIRLQSHQVRRTVRGDFGLCEVRAHADLPLGQILIAAEHFFIGTRKTVNAQGM